MDANEDAYLNAKEIKEFEPCEKYDGTKVVKAFREFGRKARIEDLADKINSKVSKDFFYASPPKCSEMCWGCRQHD